MYTVKAVPQREAAIVPEALPGRYLGDILIRGIKSVTRARRDTMIPLLKPIIGLDGTEIHEVAALNGTRVIVSIYNSNRNPDLWGEDANEWKPERWLSPLPKALVEAHIPGVYSHLMTFLGGGRSCIGFKFSQLEMKVVISILVEKFRFSRSSKDSEILWQMNTITAPIIGKANHPQLPMNISLVN
ncbi:cytochrome P450 [Lentinula edodes]|nr:cytochrome P450 [Lentinula edodes]